MERPVENEDILLLVNCKGMLIEISRLRELDEQEQRATLGSQKLDGMPHVQGGGGLDSVLERAEKLHTMREKAIDAYIRQVDECEKVLKKLEDTTLRAFVRALYVEQLPIWKAADIAHISVSTANRIKGKIEKEGHF